MKKIVVSFATLLLSISATSAAANGISEAEIISIELTNSSIVASGSNGSTSNVMELDQQVVAVSPLYEITADALDDNSIKVEISITSEDSPTIYPFRVRDLCAQNHIGGEGLGLTQLLGCDGETLGWVADPWARDSAGLKVPTHFEFDGEEVKQIVDHTSSAFTYPIIADPYLGLNLISNVSYVYPGNYPQPDLHIAVTPWMGTVYSMSIVNTGFYANAVSVAMNAGWDEVIGQIRQKYGTYAANYVISHISYKQQYGCHAIGAPLIFASTVTGFDTRPTWDLEGFRAPNANFADWVSTRCTW